MSLWRVFVVVTVCCSTVVILGMLNIWLGVLSVPVLYGIQRSLLTK
jgi:hypothetical protein